MGRKKETKTTNLDQRNQSKVIPQNIGKSEHNLSIGYFFHKSGLDSRRKEKKIIPKTNKNNELSFKKGQGINQLTLFMFLNLLLMVTLSFLDFFFCNNN